MMRRHEAAAVARAVLTSRDRGNYHLEVSRRIRDEFENGRDYHALHGREVRVPAVHDQRPTPTLLDWHNAHRFKR